MNSVGGGSPIDDPQAAPGGSAAGSQLLPAPEHEGPTSRVLRVAIKRAPIPSLSGLCFEILGLAWVFGALAGLVALSLVFDDAGLLSSAIAPAFAVPRADEALVLFACCVPVVGIATRLAAGLAWLASPNGRDHGRPTVVASWRAGRATHVSTVGTWLQVFGMMASATIVLLGPLVALTALLGQGTLGPLGAILSGLALTFALVYGAELGALQALAQASLVRHKRGVGSALLHAWRLMRSDTETTRKIATVEFIARIAVIAAAIAMGRVAGVAAGLAQFAVLGTLIGGIRCHSWALAYPKVGGLEAAVRAGDSDD